MPKLKSFRFLITGASGFVGCALSSRLLRDNLHVRGTLLSSEAPSALIQGVESVLIESLGPATSCEHALKDVDVVIHLKVDFDEYYLKNRSFLMDMRIIFRTFVKVVKSEGVQH